MSVKIEYHENDLIFFDKLGNDEMVVSLIDYKKHDKQMVLDREDAVKIVSHLVHQYRIKESDLYD